MRILVIAPHPDDETLGCGGTLLKWKKDNHEISQLIMTESINLDGSQYESYADREIEIEEIAKLYNFKKVYRLGKPTTFLDSFNLTKLVQEFGRILEEYKPNILLLPFYNDVHSDHKITYLVASSGLKWFRHPYIQKALMYETISETNFNFGPNRFKPNYFVNIESEMEEKLSILNHYKSELGEFPFPRSMEAVKSLARLHGSTSGYDYAEAFELILERN